jgi:hypothetical protein
MHWHGNAWRLEFIHTIARMVLSRLLDRPARPEAAEIGPVSAEKSALGTDWSREGVGRNVI